MKISELTKWAIENDCYGADFEVEKYNNPHNEGEISDVSPELKDLKIQRWPNGYVCVTLEV